MPQFAPSTFSSTTTTVRPLKKGHASKGCKSRSLSVRMRPWVRSRTCGVVGNLKNPGRLTSGGSAPQQTKRCSASRKLAMRITSVNPSSQRGTWKASDLLLTAFRPPPNLMVGWSVRWAARSSHSAADMSKWTQTASLGLKASSKNALRSSDLSLQRSRMTWLCWSLARRPIASSTAARPPTSSWHTRAHRWPDFSNALLKVLLPLPGSPTKMTNLG
mmetsp:Transcript_52185/g.167220  ORF Transcript_52185/g.167220 Transcript_52185/m.167220 type:complete len:217 (+) Transcript_52185:726-1376(+)